MEKVLNIIAQEAERMTQEEYGMSIEEFNACDPTPIGKTAQAAIDANQKFFDELPVGSVIQVRYVPPSSYTGPERRDRNRPISTQPAVVE